MARRVLDLDAAAPEELAVRFRGAEYVLGESVAGVVLALKLARSLPDDAAAEEQALGEVIGLLSPKLAEATSAVELTVGERLALRSAIREYVGSLGRLTFRPA